VALKIVLPQWQMTELDSVGKKTRFVAHVAHVLGLQGVTVLTGRAEDLAREREHRERYDLSLARGVAPLRVLAEYALPFCAVGALAVAMKKGDIAREIEEGRRAVGQAGGRLEPLVPVPTLPGLDGARVLVPCRKVRPTPPHLPRAAGVPAKRPL
jgi:16S rRNA (guanine527-N7)-methyltransferase